MNYWYSPLVGFVLIVVGLIFILKTDKWVRLTVESWSFLAFRGEFSNFEIKLMRVAWRIGGAIFIIFGIWIIYTTITSNP